MTRRARPFVLPPPRIAPWTVGPGERRGSYSVFDVDRYPLRDGRGDDRGEAFLIAARDWCNVVALTEEDELVLVWQFRFGPRVMSLELPGGVMDDGETPAGCARRELLEETGYETASLEPLVVVHPNPALQANRLHAFLARGAVRTRDPAFDDQEECEVALVPVEHAARLLDEGHMTHALCHAALGAFLRRRAG